jgi:hypothetical protein
MLDVGVFIELRIPMSRAKPLTRFGLLLLLAIGLLWPAIVQQRPAYFFDTAGYLNAGSKAFSLVSAKLHPDVTVGSATSQPAPKVKGVISTRAIAYSLFAALTSAPDGKLYGLVIANALIMTLLISQFWAYRAPDAAPGDVAIATLLLLAASSAPWFASYAMPDVLAGCAILAMLVMTFRGATLPHGARLAIGGIISFAVASHASHIPLIGALMLWGIGELFYQTRQNPALRRRYRVASIVAPFTIGMLMVLGLSLVGFGAVSMAPKRLPFALARSIDDGPAKWYLEDNCKTRHFAVCPFFEATGKGGPELIFSKNGLLRKATPDQMERVRAEEMTIVRAATAQYPLVQIKAAAVNAVAQFFRFGLADNSFDFVVLQAPDGHYSVHRTTERLALRDFGRTMIYGGVLLSLLYLISISRRLSLDEAGTLRMLLFALVVNAAITGALSTLTSRYQSRVIWVLPVVALGLWLARRQRTAGSLRGKLEGG